MHRRNHFVPDVDARSAVVQDALLFGWLKATHPIGVRFGPEEVFVWAQVGLADLALSGCSMSSDHLNLYPGGARLKDPIAATSEVGLRFHPLRGGNQHWRECGGLAARRPDRARGGHSGGYDPRNRPVS